MEKVHFSKTRLGLAVFTAPKQAFEEILSQRLLGSAIAITAVSGLFAFIWKLLGYYRGVNSVYELAVSNPITSLAWMFSAAFIIQFASKLNGGQGQISDTITGIGWAHLAAALFNIVSIGALYTPRLAMLSMFLYVYFAVVCVNAVERAHGFTIWRAIFTTIFGFFAVALFRGAATSVSIAVNPDLNLISSAAGSRPIADPIYLSVLAILSAAAVYTLLRQLNWDIRGRLAWSAGAFLISGAVVLATVLVTTSMSPLAHMRAGKSAYNAGNYSKAESEFDKVLRIFPGDMHVEFYLGHVYLAAGRYEPAEQQFRDILKFSGGNGSNNQNSGDVMVSARALTGVGAVEYARGNYKEAVKNYDDAVKRWPNYREAHSRKALAYAKMGDMENARKTAEKALEVGADSAIPYVVLTQVYAVQGDEKKAMDNFRMASTINKELTDRVGNSPDKWKMAVDYVTTEFLKYPLETEPLRVMQALKEENRDEE